MSGNPVFLQKLDSLKQLSGYYLDPDAKLVSFGDGIYKKTYDQFGNSVWTVLLNKYRAVGWYHVNSPFVNTGEDELVSPKLVSIDGYRTCPMYPATYSDFYKDKNISFFKYFTSSEEKEKIMLFLHDDGELIATMNPDFQEETAAGPRNFWKHYIEGSDDSEELMDMFFASKGISELPFLNPTTDTDYKPIPSGHPSWDDPELEEYNEEYRHDPMNNKLYTEQEFYEYYGRGLEWDLQHPLKVWRRTKINDMIFKYRNTLNDNNINHLLDKLIETFV